MKNSPRYDCPRCGRKDGLVSGPKSPAGKTRWQCRGGDRKNGYCYSTTNPQAKERDVTGRVKQAKNPQFNAGMSGKRFIITAAQNNTPLHTAFWASLQTAAGYYDAQIRVIPIRYKNPTSLWTELQDDDEKWLIEQKYLRNTRHRFNENLQLLADVKTQPTATDPLAGFEAITHSESGILGHTKMALKSIATPSSQYPKLLMSTGACTVPNYTDTRAGKIGEFHHTLGAILVEVRGKRFHVRQINAKKDGTFYGTPIKGKGCVHFTPEGFTTGHRAAGIVFGDTHVHWIDPEVEAATFAPGGIVDVLQPKEQVFNDLNDGYAVNPHHKGNPFNEIAKYFGDKKCARTETFTTIDYIVKRTRPDQRSTVVSSNHDDFLRRWIVSADWKNDPINADFYLETALKMVRGTKMTERGTEYPNPFVMWARERLPTDGRFTVLDSDDSHLIEGVEVGMHGDRGPNGSRGSIKNLRRIGVKSIIGHSHSPGISEGCYQTGTMTRLRLEYNGGPSSWLHTHCVIWPDGKRCLINIIGGEWRL